jgi:hypothetical protein
LILFDAADLGIAVPDRDGKFALSDTRLSAKIPE